jgi:hypothetical protein
MGAMNCNPGPYTAPTRMSEQMKETAHDPIPYHRAKVSISPMVSMNERYNELGNGKTGT